jgi:hypothetical protein
MRTKMRLVWEIQQWLPPLLVELKRQVAVLTTIVLSALKKGVGALEMKKVVQDATAEH